MTNFSKSKRRLRRSAKLLLLLITSLTAISVAGLSPYLPNSHLAYGGVSPPVLGIDCALGSTQATLDPNSNLPVGDGALDTSCTWVGDVDVSLDGLGDDTVDPLVSDNPGLFPAGTGGGFTAELRATGLPPGINGFDIIISWNTKYLYAIKFDLTGLAFGNSSYTPFTALSTLDNTVGQARLAMVVLNPPGPLPGPSGGDMSFFRIKFDVVGAGTTGLTISDDIITKGGPAVAHTTQSASLDSRTYYDPGGLGFNWDVSWSFSPARPAPGQTLTMSASASCPGCIGTLSYSWDTNSDGTADAAGIAASITPPTATLLAHRVTLTISNGTVSAAAVRRLPFNMTITGPSNLAVGVPATWEGKWLGGIPNYTGNWRLCPGTSTNTVVCSKPNPAVSSTPGQTNNATDVTYNFAGVYNNSLRITQAASPQISPTPESQTVFLVVNVTGSPQAYTVTVTSDLSNPLASESVTFTAAVTYDAAYPTSLRSSAFRYTFEFGDGAELTLTGPGSVSTTRSYQSDGTYTVKVTVRETSGVAVSKILEVGRLALTVNPALPIQGTINLGPTPSLVTGSAVSFTATGSGGGPPYIFTWSFGDGSTGTGESVSHTYTATGTYTVTLTVTDRRGVQQTFTRSLEISAPPSADQTPLLLGAGVAVAAVAGLIFFLRGRRPRAVSAPRK